ncbi:MAG: hypothetical protein GYA17_17035 [Chloroflexi bacterium]|jgi:hypothetical protein|nr:hypothetical protein [Anaerolineaceae bacterium]NMB90065.1 hypothetical protein [Chloroflexota bacterium]
MAFTMDTTLGALLDHPQAKPILDKHFPGITTNPLVGMVKGLSLNTILSTPQAAQFGLTREKVETVLTEVNKFVQ